MEIYKLLDQLEEILEDCSHIPLTRKLIVDEDELLEFLDRIRTVLPQEIKETAAIMHEKERIINEACSKAERILTEGRKQIERMANETEVVRLAKEKAEEINRKTVAEAQEMKQGAKDYAVETLSKLEESLENTLQTVKQGRSILHEEINIEKEA